MVISKYNNKTFVELFPNETLFCNYVNGSGVEIFEKTQSLKTTFWLIYAKYGNNPIANEDENQSKAKFLSVMFRFGPSWEKNLEIQKSLRSLTEEDICKGGRIINNRALNPSTIPQINDTEEICEVNEQTVAKSSKSKIEGYSLLLDLLKNDVTSEYVDKFKECFQQFFVPNNDLIYIEED